ncbi:MAG: hypothetical protein M1816_000377 [Peltula sp. TS41687]|nr:MAG: hypothetical protein M1816_000377 [Peltula sp. TS41687]
MPGVKRGRGESMSGKDTSSSPYMPMFHVFRNELDEHHDRRERVIKASRDITALSKKMIFSLQRLHQFDQKLLEHVTAENAGREKDIAQLFESISEDLYGINGPRYQRQISGAIQEFIEAVSFAHYIRHQTLITPAEASGSIAGGAQLTADDYILGIFDLVGEMMRFAITHMATSGSLPGQTDSGRSADGADQVKAVTVKRDIVMDLRSLRAYFESLNTGGATGNSWLGKEVEKKMEVMKSCVDKVENAVYGMIIRGRERPKGWVPSLRDDMAGAASEAVESY